MSVMREEMCPKLAVFVLLSQNDDYFSQDDEKSRGDITLPELLPTDSIEEEPEMVAPLKPHKDDSE